MISKQFLGQKKKPTSISWYGPLWFAYVALNNDPSTVRVPQAECYGHRLWWMIGLIELISCRISLHPFPGFPEVEARAYVPPNHTTHHT